MNQTAYNWMTLDEVEREIEYYNDAIGYHQQQLRQIKSKKKKLVKEIQDRQQMELKV